MRILRLILLVIAFLPVFFAAGQVYNYSGINVQGELMSSLDTEVDLEFRVIDYSNTIAWSENHSGVILSDRKSFNLMLGHGTFITGNVAQFTDIDWLNVQRVDVYRTDLAPPYLILSMDVLPVPYALHSLTTGYVPFTFELTDNPNPSPPLYYLLKFNGSSWYLAPDILSDDVDFSWNAAIAAYADTAGVAITNASTADTSELAFYSDSAGYSSTATYTVYADSATFTDSTNIVPYSTGNWGFTGNAGTVTSNYVGASDAYFTLRTNNTNRLIFGNGESVYNAGENGGFSLFSTRGALFQTNGNPGISTVDNSYLYFDGQHAAFFGGETSFGLDTAVGQYSFAWGKDVGTNGTYSTVFGYKAYGDSALAFGVMYDAISGFGFGRNIIAGHMGVAIGDSCRTLYYRNVAIGKNVEAGSNSASLGMGVNIVSSGATSWAMGNNVSAIGHFSTVMGSYASSNGRAAFVYGDNSTTSIVTSTVNYQFVVRASGGYIFYTDPDLTMGVEILPGAGSWSMISDRNKKENITALGYDMVSSKITLLNLYSWRYIGDSVVHLGPMAQDFNGAFGVGELPNYINMIDSDGVIFWGIKSLDENLKAEMAEEEVDKTARAVETEKGEYEELLNRINTLYEKLDE